MGALFFGLWLIPMGGAVLRSGWMPRPLGWVLVSGGIGYLLICGVRRNASQPAPAEPAAADRPAPPAAMPTVAG